MQCVVRLLVCNELTDVVRSIFGVFIFCIRVDFGIVDEASKDFYVLLYVLLSMFIDCGYFLEFTTCKSGTHFFYR